MCSWGNRAPPDLEGERTMKLTDCQIKACVKRVMDGKDTSPATLDLCRHIAAGDINRIFGDDGQRVNDWLHTITKWYA
jgi:hypothetical protein